MLAVQSLPDVAEKIRCAAPGKTTELERCGGEGGWWKVAGQVRISPGYFRECVFYAFAHLSPFTVLTPYFLTLDSLDIQILWSPFGLQTTSKLAILESANWESIPSFPSISVSICFQICSTQKAPAKPWWCPTYVTSLWPVQPWDCR